MAFSVQDWEIVKSFYERGFSLSEIVDRPEVKIKARSQISRKAKKEGWKKATGKQQLVEKEVNIKQSIKDVYEQKATFSATELLVHDTLVAEKASNIVFFNSSQMRLSAIGMQLVEEKLEDKGLLFDESGNQVLIPKLSTLELKQVSDVVKTSREGVLGKDPDTAINIHNTNAQANMVKELPSNPLDAAKVYQDMIGK